MKAHMFTEKPEMYKIINTMPDTDVREHASRSHNINFRMSVSTCTRIKYIILIVNPSLHALIKLN